MALLRDVRGGKGEQKLFHECAIWLLKHHPLTLISNLSEVVKVTQSTPICLSKASCELPYEAVQLACITSSS